MVGAPGTASWQHLTPSSAQVESFAWSPDGQWLAVVELSAAPPRTPGSGPAHLVAIRCDGEARVELLADLEAATVVRWQ